MCCAVEPPKHFIDPISLEVMEDPIIVTSGVSYDRMSIIRMIEAKDIELPFQRRDVTDFGFTCPVTRVKCSAPIRDGMPQFVTNRGLRDAIEEWKFMHA
eukprot:SAG11_NODE_883_length_6737_cov_10.576981_9_plen_99_part_00